MFVIFESLYVVSCENCLSHIVQVLLHKQTTRCVMFAVKSYVCTKSISKSNPYFWHNVFIYFVFYYLNFIIWHNILLRIGTDIRL